MLNPLPNDKIFNFSMMKALAADKLQIIMGHLPWWNKEKVLVTSIFYFSHNVLNSLLPQDHLQAVIV